MALKTRLSPIPTRRHGWYKIKRMNQNQKQSEVFFFQSPTNEDFQRLKLNHFQRCHKIISACVCECVSTKPELSKCPHPLTWNSSYFLSSKVLDDKKIIWGGGASTKIQSSSGKGLWNLIFHSKVSKKWSREKKS